MRTQALDGLLNHRRLQMTHAACTPTRTFLGSRNEESALFSMSSLRARVVGGAAAQPGESSGYVDVTELMADAATSQATRTSAAYTLIGAPVAADDLPQTETKGFLQAIVGVLALGIASMAAHISWDRLPSTPPPAKSMVVITGPQADDYETRSVPDAPETHEDDDDDTVLFDDSEQPKTSRKARSKRKQVKRSTKSKRPSQPKAPAKAKAEPEPKPEPAPKTKQLPKSMSVECLLNPDECREPQTKSKAKPQKPAADELPHKLTLAQLKQGTSATKKAAQRVCSSLADPGTKLQVKLSITGKTGSVAKAHALGSAAGTQLGTCVAKELAASTFPKVAAPQQGTVVTIRF